MRLSYLSGLAIAGLGRFPVAALDFYISPTGSDNNDGSSADASFATIEHAQGAVRDQISSSLTDNITVHLAPGLYPVAETLNFTAEDSGRDGFTVNWDGPGAVVSGGIEVTGWEEGSDGVWSASVPKGTESRNLYVNGQAANFARRKLANRKDFQFTSSGMTWSNGQYDWLMDTEGIAGAEVRFINSFTDRYALIQSASNRQLAMKQNTWFNNMWGYDTVAQPNADFGVWVQNALALISDGGQFYLDSAAGTVYYKPLDGENLTTATTYLGVLECIVSVGGTYDDPAHDLTFTGISFAHSTWMKPATVGYPDQQTGAYIGENSTYTPSNFESTRPHWFQMPGAIQISAATNITFSGGNYTQLGGGGIGIGNDANAHTSGVGLGAAHITVSNAYFTQIMGNSITAGGVQADAHHPSNAGMTNSHLIITNNVFYNTSSLFTSTVPILLTYAHHSTISHNDLHITPYSGICHGYGWGSNDAGGSPEYQNRGLYNFQPKYSDPTTSNTNLIAANFIRAYGHSHTDLGGIYTLSKSPSTFITENYVLDSGAYGLYTDEGSNSYTFTDNLLFNTGTWLAQNGANTDNNTFDGNYGHSGPTNWPGNSLIDNISQASVAVQRAAYRAGVEPGKRVNRPETSETGAADSIVTVTGDGQGVVTATISNFDDAAFEGVEFDVSSGSSGVTFTAEGEVPKEIQGNGDTVVKWKASGGGGSVKVSVGVKYTNSRTGEVGERGGSADVSL
ncbi:pectin lyase [Dichotomopilus funicola]|uniref:Pectin lyase n=1 Tax=Dichotomopilus funicola TaxID=1934379 RepID=A0AAN6V3J0_9PEZI|nr:pectin lyase [Dichotomopilus funicola]